MLSADVLRVIAATTVPTAIRSLAVFLTNGSGAPLPVSVSGAGGTVAQGNKGSIAQSWYAQLTDGSANAISIRSLASSPGDIGLGTFGEQVIKGGSSVANTANVGFGVGANALRVTAATDGPGGVAGNGTQALAMRVVLATDGVGSALAVVGGGGESTALRTQLADGSLVAVTTGWQGTAPYTGADLANGVQTAVSSSAVQVGAASATAVYRILQNVGANACRIGTTGVTATTGFRLAAGEKVIFGPPYCPGNALLAIRETADTTVLYQEVAYV